MPDVPPIELFPFVRQWKQSTVYNVNTHNYVCYTIWFTKPITQSDFNTNS